MKSQTFPIDLQNTLQKVSLGCKRSKPMLLLPLINNVFEMYTIMNLPTDLTVGCYLYLHLFPFNFQM